MKKLLSVLLVLAMMFSLSTVAFAADETNPPVAADGKTEPDNSTVSEQEPGAVPEAPEPEPSCKTDGKHSVEKYVSDGAGRHTGVCALCGETVSEACDLVAGTPVLPTQTEKGYTEYVCSVCGYTAAQDETEAEADRKESRFVGDVDNDGSVLANDARLLLRAAVSLEKIGDADVAFSDCNADGEVTAADARLALRASVGLETMERHDYRYTKKASPTCTKPGSGTVDCAYCGVSRALTVPANGHSYGEAKIVAATCTKDGKSTQTCQVCGAKKEYKLRATGHSFGDPAIIEASCVKDGSSTLTCTVCGYKQVEVLPAPGHSYGEPEVVAATCTEDGSSTVTCVRCGDKQATKLPATGHQWVPATVARAKHCEYCGAVVAGWATVDGKSYYFLENGEMAKNQIVDGKYVGSDGLVVNDDLIRKAIAFVAANGGKGSNADKLRNCFYVISRYQYVSIHNAPSPAAMKTSANRMFTQKSGNCYCYAAMFAYVATVLGYQARVNCGKILAIGGRYMTPHGWTEVLVDGGWYVCDGSSQNHRGVNAFLRPRQSFPIRLTSGTIYTLYTKNGVAAWA